MTLTTGTLWNMCVHVQSKLPPSKGHFVTYINYTAFVERLSSSRRFKMYKNYMYIVHVHVHVHRKPITCTCTCNWDLLRDLLYHYHYPILVRGFTVHTCM